MVALVCGIESESPVSLLLEALKKKKADFVLLDQQDLAEDVQLRWSLSTKGVVGELKVRSQVIDLQEITGVFYRFMSVDHMPEVQDNPSYLQRTRSVLHALLDLFDVLPARIINNRRAMVTNNSKPYQSLLIRGCGFNIPDTIITNTPRNAKEFISHQPGVIYKSISAIRSIVEEVDGEYIDEIERIRLLPTQFQEKIIGENVRVHVVGEKVFPTKIKTSAVDYRYPHNYDETVTLEACNIEKSLELKCIDLTRSLGLNFSGIDLIISPQGVYCLEVNTSPAYSFYQQYSKQRISDAVADFITLTD